MSPYENPEKNQSHTKAQKSNNTRLLDNNASSCKTGCGFNVFWDNFQQSFKTSQVIGYGEEMAIHSSILALRILWTEESMGSQRVRHD